VQVTREAFGRYMRVIKRALTDAAAKESARAAEVALASPEEPASADQTASKRFHLQTCMIDTGECCALYMAAVPVRLHIVL